ncbi:MAG: response regulator [Fulvivirga sp.]|uniref:response regulator n=1 Tax=Fulvivirga sp. TaxID=1931237 RepID=UPI0032F06CB9
MIRTGLVDDHKLFRMTFSAILENYPKFDIVAQYSNIGDALKNLKEDNIDFYFIDLEIGLESGLELGKEIKCQSLNTKLILMTMDRSSEIASKAHEIGFDEIFYKDFDFEDFNKRLILLEANILNY